MGNYNNELVLELERRAVAAETRVKQLERTERKVSDVREAIAYRLEKVWEADPAMIGDLLSWEWHKPSEFILAMRRDLEAKNMDFTHGSDAHHVLRLIAVEEISADKGAELLDAIQRGKSPVLPNLTI